VGIGAIKVACIKILIIKTMTLEERVGMGDGARGRRGKRCGCYRVIMLNMCKDIVQSLGARVLSSGVGDG
jgi:hypothetical protein